MAPTAKRAKAKPRPLSHHGLRILRRTSPARLRGTCWASQWTSTAGRPLLVGRYGGQLKPSTLPDPMAAPPTLGLVAGPPDRGYRARSCEECFGPIDANLYSLPMDQSITGHNRS